MPVNMDPSKKRKRTQSAPVADTSQCVNEKDSPDRAVQFGEETEEDRVKALADAELKNLWEATEVIDMDKV